MTLSFELGEETFSKKAVVVGQKILISKKGCFMGWDNFLKGVQAIFRENRKLNGCSIINN